MNQTSKTITFFGSGPVAAASLEYLHTQFGVELVITKHRPAHHKDPAPVEEFAKAHGLRLDFADTTDELESVIISQQPDKLCGVVIDYGVIISQPVIDYFEHGIINSHFSILPEWRGADPITFSLLSGQQQTGVSLMRINAGLDTGAIIAESFVTIEPDETNTTLTEKLIATSNTLISTKLPDYIDRQIIAVPQAPERITTHSRKLTKQDGILDPTKPAQVLEREIRAFNVWPKSKLIINNQLTVIVTQAAVANQHLQPGELLVTQDNKQLILGTRVGSLAIIELMPLGKQKMTTAAFLNGYGNRI